MMGNDLFHMNHHVENQMNHLMNHQMDIKMTSNGWTTNTKNYLRTNGRETLFSMQGVLEKVMTVSQGIEQIRHFRKCIGSWGNCLIF